MEAEPNPPSQFTFTRSLSNVSVGARRLTATQMRQIQKMKRESLFENDPYLNQTSNLLNASQMSQAQMQTQGNFHSEMNTTSNRELRKACENNPFQIPFPNLENNDFGEIPATSSNSNSMMNFFHAMIEERPKRKLSIENEQKKEDETYKWSSSDLSIKTNVTLFSPKPFDHLFDCVPLIMNNSFLGNPNGEQREEAPLQPQYKYSRQPQFAGLGSSDFLNALRSVYATYKKEQSKKFYILLKGITCLFYHKKEQPGPKESLTKSAHRTFSSSVVIACERKSFQQTLTKNGIDFEHFNNQENNEETEIMEKMPFESQTAFTKSFDFVSNLDIYIIRKKHVQAFFNIILNETESEAQLEIIAEYPFANSAIFYPKIAYNGPIRLNEVSEVNAENDIFEEFQDRQALIGFKIFEDERSLKTLYKLQVEGCILPLTLKGLMENIEKRQKLLKTLVTPHFITEKFNSETLGEI